VATTDWAGISVALANGQVDVAWMGPWGYILAHDDSGVTPIATAKYDGKPIYHAIVVCRPDLPVKVWPDDGKAKRVSFADVGSTSGWLIPTAWFRTRGIDPKQFFKVHLAVTYADRIVALRAGRIVEDAPAARFDTRALDQIYDRTISP
jgi:phosphonate transport system substrate-binding protein